MRPPKDWFEYTEKEKCVMWLNASLTVKRDESGSHQGIWSLFMSELIKHVKKLQEEKKIKEKIEWHLWGEEANRLSWQIKDDKNDVHTACHPCKPGDDFINDFYDHLDLLWRSNE